MSESLWKIIQRKLNTTDASKIMSYFKKMYIVYRALDTLGDDAIIFSSNKILYYDSFSLNADYPLLSIKNRKDKAFEECFIEPFCESIILNYEGAYYVVPYNILYAVFKDSPKSLFNQEHIVVTDEDTNLNIKHCVRGYDEFYLTKDVYYKSIKTERFPVTYYNNGLYTYVMVGTECLGVLPAKKTKLKPAIIEKQESEVGSAFKREYIERIEETNVTLLDDTIVLKHPDNFFVEIKKKDITPYGIKKMSIRFGNAYLHKDEDVQINFIFMNYLFFSLTESSTVFCLPLGVYNNCVR